MAVRDLSPTAYIAPGTMSLGLNLVISAHCPDPVPLDKWLSNYSPSADVTVTTAVATFQTIATLVPSLDANARMIIIIPPIGNSTAITLKGISGDTGVPLHPNGIAVLAVPSGGAPTWGITTAAAIVAVRIIII